MFAYFKNRKIVFTYIPIEQKVTKNEVTLSICPKYKDFYNL